MITYPLFREDGSLYAFEISNFWISMRSIFMVLRSIEGVVGIKRERFDDDRASFTFQGERWVVHEPFVDNSRYWIGPDQGFRSSLDATDVNDAFRRFEWDPWWRRVARLVAARAATGIGHGAGA